MSDDDPFDSDEWRAYAARARRELVPMMQGSSVHLSLAPPPGEVDVKFATELGFMVMMDKPVIVVVPPGQSIPSKLAKIADEIIEGPIDSSGFRARLSAALERL